MPRSGAFGLFPKLKGEWDRKEQFSDAFARLYGDHVCFLGIRF